MRALAVVMMVPALVLGTTRAEAVPCRLAEPQPAVLTPSGATIASGGIVVANPPGQGWQLSEPSFGTANLRWSTIAPGLAVLGLPSQGSFELRDDKHALLVTVATGRTQHKPLPAPKPSSVKLVPRKSRGGDTTIVATFASKPPERAVALIVYAKGKARSWGRVGKASSIIVYQGVCQTTPPAGTVASRAGDAVTLAWLDDTGNVSSPSTTVKIR